jgi:XTP/dITP diphosphohydrolase
MRDLLAGIGLAVAPQSELGVPEAEETGLTFVENAIIKARNAAEHTGMPAIADDSGIEVDALDGEPGIRSARYAGPRASDAENLAKLLAALAPVPAPERTARYQCVVLYLAHPRDPTPLVCQGTWEGLVVDRPRGSNGFGYDPAFWLPDLGMTAAELEPAVKNRISHRAIALARLRAALGEG